MARRPICLCGHSWSSHAGAEHHRHRRGHCRAFVPTFVGTARAADEPCGCTVYNGVGAEAEVRGLLMPMRRTTSTHTDGPDGSPEA